MKNKDIYAYIFWNCITEYFIYNATLFLFINNWKYYFPCGIFLTILFWGIEYKAYSSVLSESNKTAKTKSGKTQSTDTIGETNNVVSFELKMRYHDWTLTKIVVLLFACILGYACDIKYNPILLCICSLFLILANDFFWDRQSKHSIITVQWELN